MTISSRNIFDYDSMLTKKRQLNVRELRVRTKERDLISQALTQRNTEDDSQSRLIRAQRFFELGFEFPGALINIGTLVLSSHKEFLYICSFSPIVHP